MKLQRVGHNWATELNWTYFLSTPQGMWDPSSPNLEPTPPGVEVQSLNPWLPGKSPNILVHNSKPERSKKFKENGTWGKSNCRLNFQQWIPKHKTAGPFTSYQREGTAIDANTWLLWKSEFKTPLKWKQRLKKKEIHKNCFKIINWAQIKINLLKKHSLTVFLG